MSDTVTDRIDLDSLTDDEVKNLTPEQVQTLMNQENSGDYANEPVVNPEIVPNADDDNEYPDDTASGEDGTKEGESGDPEDKTPPEDGKDEDLSKTDPNAAPEDAKPGDEKGEEDKSTEPNADKKAEEKPKKDADADVAAKAETDAAIDFFKKVSAPFKADGKDIQVRTPEDAIRLMQMGVNYSRRMQEMKPLKAIDQMLKTNGINSVEKLNELIDISKGNPQAIQKLLKDKGIDPLDIDTSKENVYRPNNYQPDPKDTAFQEAIDNTVAAEGGIDLIKDVNAMWDDTSKEALRDQPSIFNNLLEQKQNGVYEKVKTELVYQRTLGFLTDVPFLQAYHAVADAMEKAGVFNSLKPNEVHSNGGNKTPIDTGTRKAATATKTEQPNPNLSSTTQPRIAPSNGGNQNEPDYSSMSDEDFLKMPPPS